MKKILAVGSVVALASVSSFAAVLQNDISVDTADFTHIAVGLVAALGTLWAIRRALGLLGR